MGLQGMINDLVKQSDFTLGEKINTDNLIEKLNKKIQTL